MVMEAKKNYVVVLMYRFTTLDVCYENNLRVVSFEGR